VVGLGKFRGSKYVQSCIGDTYNQATGFLKQGRQVLFSGTPCQIAGLRSYLGKDYGDLICADIVCHGVPSPLVWQRYKMQMEERNQAKTEKISFRRKNCGWKIYSVSFSFDNNTEYIKPLTEDVYMKGFLRDLYLRPSCYECSFKTLNRQSDITLADFWGIQNVLPSFDDDKGTSLVLVNSSKGAEIFAAIADKISCREVDVNQAVSCNPSAIKSVDYNPKREKFFKELLGSEDVSELIKRYTKVDFSKRAYAKIRGLVSRAKRIAMG
jgi:coenzyme F420-reducing hydrogenase beta subunit